MEQCPLPLLFAASLLGLVLVVTQAGPGACPLSSVPPSWLATWSGFCFAILTSTLWLIPFHIWAGTSRGQFFHVWNCSEFPSAFTWLVVLKIMLGPWDISVCREDVEFCQPVKYVWFFLPPFFSSFHALLTLCGLHYTEFKFNRTTHPLYYLLWPGLLKGGIWKEHGSQSPISGSESAGCKQRVVLHMNVLSLHTLCLAVWESLVFQICTTVKKNIHAKS